MDQVGYAAAFTFKYSPRKGTLAAGAEDQIPEAVKKERLKKLNELQGRKTAENNLKYLGHRGEVLVEGFDRRGETILFGKLGVFKMVYFPGDEKLLGTYQTVTVTECARNSLLGRME
jgi:tRNA-2-methylthio-N6-dimethylallyladenosine synthase